MKQLTKHDVNKLTASELKDILPFVITSDGETIAAVIPVCDVNKLQARLEPPPELVHNVNRLEHKGHDVNELPLSKRKQAEGRLNAPL